jgi:hypothetical protein
MGVSLSKYGLRGDAQPLVGFAVQEGVLGAEAEEWDATGVMRAGGCR